MIINNLTSLNLDRVLNIGIALSAERNVPRLLETILSEAMAITNCDAGTLYLYEDDLLHFKIMRNHTMKTYKGGGGEPIDLPPVTVSEENVCAYAVLHRTLENIEDVYFSRRFDFSGPRNYDKLTGYRTKSMLVIPLENNRGSVIGVLQLINALDDHENVIPFAKEFEPIFRSVAAQAAIAITNMNYLRENQALLLSLVEVLAAAIDERSHYSSNHTKNVANLVSDFTEFINKAHDRDKTSICFSEEDRQQIIIAAWLHDIGKIITPLEIMDKSTRLGQHRDMVMLRFDAIYAAENLHFLQGKLTPEEWETISREILEAKALCEKSNTGTPTSKEELEIFHNLSHRTTLLPTGESMPWLTPEEVESLAISYGTLTAKERKVMEDHVVITQRLLNKIKFSKEYSSVPLYAAAHHEKLNGKGYPNGLEANQLPIGTRILTIIDVFEALTAKDRPYKQPMSIERAFDVLDKMIADGELDNELVDLLKEWRQL